MCFVLAKNDTGFNLRGKWKTGWAGKGGGGAKEDTECEGG